MYKNLYGSDFIAAQYCGLNNIPRAARGLWMHGWSDIRAVRTPLEFFGITIPSRKTLLLVSTLKFKKMVKEHGFTNVVAIGLPFCYVKEIDIKPVPGSLLVIPPHSIEGVEFVGADISNYADYINSIKKNFSTIEALVYHYDYDSNSPIMQAMKKINIKIIRGADDQCNNTLNNIYQVFKRFDFMTTNCEGSHIAYAAACGLKISISGPFFSWKKNNLVNVDFYKDYPKYSASNLLQEESNVRARLGQFFVDPNKSNRCEDWGKQEIGYFNKLSPFMLKHILGWNIFGNIRYKLLKEKKLW